LSLLLRDTKYTAHAAGIVARVNQKPRYMPIESAQLSLLQSNTPTPVSARK
jgi:hypothetical protein